MYIGEKKRERYEIEKLKMYEEVILLTVLSTFLIFAVDAHAQRHRAGKVVVAIEKSGRIMSGGIVHYEKIKDKHS